MTSVMAAAAEAWDAPRIHALCEGNPSRREVIETMLRIAVAGLARMRLPDGRGFAHSLREVAPGELARVGASARYTAIALLGCRWLDEPLQQRVLGGPTAREFCGPLVERGGREGDLGDAALIAWAAVELEHPRAERALARMEALARAQQTARSYTVELAWQLSAWAAARERGASGCDAGESAAARLLEAFCPSTGLFARRTPFGRVGGRLLDPRGHVACFADQVYPIQALARYHRAFGAEDLRRIAESCASRIRRLQGPAGQWWWHYDVRAGTVVEEYPVYSVHQDAMGPMCLFDLAESGGPDAIEAIRRSVDWLVAPPELATRLIEPEADVIWRKIGRTDPARLVRRLRATTTRVRPAWRIRALDRAFPPLVVDRECRPYHLGWVLATWLGRL